MKYKCGLPEIVLDKEPLNGSRLGRYQQEKSDSTPSLNVSALVPYEAHTEASDALILEEELEKK